MPCMGPDCESARAEGNRVGNAIYKMIVESHGLSDFSDLRSQGKIIEPLFDFQVKNWSKAKESLIKAVEELFVQEACNSF